ncbi:hypothetical protein [Actinoallomurus sp. CA-142502]|uniref:hypothetical protein n=1 Tax=Actinoallomurus sp. CA-142502 TaxID=3239885 RepID=UPI003D900B23
MAERNSGWVGGSVVTAQEARLATGALAQAGAGPIQARSGIKPAAGTPGLVKQTGTASKSVTVEPFQAVIQGSRATAAGPYLATLDAQKTLDLLTATPADGTNARRDLIIARQSDTQWSDASTAMVVQQVVGAPSGSPVDPTPTAGDYLTLARVTIPANATTITAAMITDLRPYAVATGGILPVASQAERDALAKFVGMSVWRMDTSPNQLETWNGTSWVVVGPQPQPAYAADFTSTARTINTTGAYSDYTGQPSVTVTVPASGALWVQWGFRGYNNNSATSTARLAPAMSGANTVNPVPNDSGGATVIVGTTTGAQATSPQSASAARLYTGLTPGSTTVKLVAYISSGSSSTNAFVDSWLMVAPRP